VIATSPEAFREAVSRLPLPAEFPSTMRSALLVSPRQFRLIPGSSPDNRYVQWDASVDTERALAQHRSLVETLERLGLGVHLIPGHPDLPDGVFPNNVFATTEGRLVVGAMRHPVRQGESDREEILALFRDEMGYELRDLSRSGVVAEMTGPLVIDRARGIGYCGMTERVDEAGCEAMHHALGLRLTFRFDLHPGEYHTNVVMAILAGRVAVLHAPSFMDPRVPEEISRIYPGRTLLLDEEEKLAFAGNCISVTSRDVLMSATARSTLRPSSVALLEREGFRIHAVEVSELEKAGGSVRCMVAEIF
jgi:N-dimethylarginine dimethylaminohydrolase